MGTALRRAVRQMRKGHLNASPCRHAAMGTSAVPQVSQGLPEALNEYR